MNYALTQKLKSFLQKINLEKLENIFFSLFLLSIPLQTRLTFITDKTYLFDTFNEYTTYFIYLSDIFLFTTFFISFVKLLSFPYFFSIKNIEKYFTNHQNNEPNKNTYHKDPLTKSKIISIIKHTLSTSPQLIPIILLLSFVLWSFITIIWARYQDIALFKSLKLLELLLLFIYLYKKLYSFGLHRTFTLIFVAGIAESIIGIIQYFHQHSIGLKLLGESFLNPNIDNVAKIIINGEHFIRAYGTFPHPNVFGAFLLLSIFCGIWLLLSSKKPKDYKIISRTASTASLIQKTAYLKQNNHIVSRETISNKARIGKTISVKLLLYLSRLFHVKQLFKNSLNKTQKVSLVLVVLSIAIIIGVYWNKIALRSVDSNQAYQQSTDNRVLYNDIAINIIMKHYLLGTGNGNFTLEMSDYSLLSLKWWQYQPVHNIYLLITAELGLIGITMFLIFIVVVLKHAFCAEIFKIVSRETILTNTKDKKIMSNRDIEGKTIHTELSKFLLKLFHVKQFQKIIYILWLGFLIIAIILQFFALILTYSRLAWFGFGLIIVISIVIIFKPFKIVSRETILSTGSGSNVFLTKYIAIPIFITFIVMGLFDHYFWTLQQGQLVFWLILGIIFSLNYKK